MSVKDDQRTCTQLILGVLSVKGIIRKTLIKNYLKDLQLYINFATKILINLFCY